MKIILTTDVAKLGRKNDVKEVNSGYALNMLIPKGLAIAATPAALKRAEGAKAAAEGERKVQEELLAKNMKDLENVTLTISGKANEKGHLFAGIHKDVIVAELLKQAKLSLDPSFIQLEHPIKEAGEHTIEVKAGGRPGKFKLVVLAIK